MCFHVDSTVLTLAFQPLASNNMLCRKEKQERGRQQWEEGNPHAAISSYERGLYILGTDTKASVGREASTKTPVDSSHISMQQINHFFSPLPFLLHLTNYRRSCRKKRSCVKHAFRF